MADSATPIYAWVEPEVGASTDSWGGKVNGVMVNIENEIARTRIPFVTPAVAATTTLDLNQTTGGRVFAFTVNQITTIAFSNVPAATFFARWLAKITNGGASAVTWPAAVVWEFGAAPTLATIGVDWVEFFTLDGGTTVYGHVVHANATATFSPIAVGLLSNLTTVSGAEVSLGTISVPAGISNASTRAVRIQVRAQFSVASAPNSLRVKYGGTYVATRTGDGIVTIDVTVGYVSAVAQRAHAFMAGDGADATFAVATPAEALAGAITIDIRGAVAGGVTLTVISASAEVI